MKSLAATFSLPTAQRLAAADPRRRVLEDRDAVRLGRDERQQRRPTFGVTSRGGYDCSGFVWRVYKLQSYANEGNLASTIEGRTTYTMSVEVPRSQRIGFKKLQPADVIFFGTNGPKSTGSQVIHTGDLRRQRLVHPVLRQGVALAQLTGWYKQKFAWGRRPLREAGLEP